MFFVLFDGTGQAVGYTKWYDMAVLYLYKCVWLSLITIMAPKFFSDKGVTPASLQNISGSTQVAAHDWNKAWRGTRDLPSQWKLEVAIWPKLLNET